VFGDDPTARELEAETAALLGKEAALFVPSGTMGNQVAIATHTQRGDEVICEATAHIFLYEAAGPAALSGVQLHPVHGERGLFGLDALRGAIRAVDPHFPPTRLLALENTHNRAGGRVLPYEALHALTGEARRRGIATHLDGARIWNAAAATGRPEREWAALFDSVSVCFSKGLGAPIGSAVTGPRDWVERARFARKRFGGGMRQAGILAAAGIVALTEMVPRLSDDHCQARRLADALAAQPELELSPDRVDINMVFVRFRPGCGTEPGVRFVAALRRRGILTYPPEGGRVRFVTHHDVTAADIDRVIASLEPALAEVRAGGC